MTRLRFLPAAEAELLHETDYYSKARRGFGVRFKDAIRAATDRALAMPEAGAPGLGGTRKVRVKGFPFNVYYRHSTHEVLVVAVAADSRRPGYWLSRIDDVG